MKKFVLAVAIVTLASSTLLAHPHRAQRQAMRRAFAQLDLTDAQRSSIRAIRERDAEGFISLHNQLREKGREYRRMREANDPQAEKLRTEITALREAARSRRQAVQAEVRSILTPEQRQRLDEMKQRRRERRNR